MDLHFTSSRGSFLHLSVLCATLVVSGGGCFSWDGGAGTGGVGGGGAGGGIVVSDCFPVDPSCPLSQPCLARTTNAGASKFGMRISELTIRTPFALTAQSSSTGVLVGIIFDDAVSPSINACENPSSDSGPAAWLLGFDLGQKTLTMGDALATSTTQTQFTFLDEMVAQGGQTYHVGPVTSGLIQNPDGSFGSAPQDFAFPLFLDTSSNPTIIPFHALSVSNVTVSASHDCIGSYDPAVFDPKQLCMPTVHGQNFRHAGNLEGYFSLAEADTITLGAIKETFCYVLTGDMGTIDPTTQIQHCSRTNGVISFKGDWCSTTNGPATATCADAMHVTADFAASAVQLQP